jgi:NhaP-type Na+/H+ or K+/H+ antiporter
MDLKIRDNTAHMLWFAGLRGAVAYACAKTFPNVFGNRSVMVFTTMVIVLFTVFVFGCTTEIALNFFQIEMHVDEEKYMEDNETLVKMDFINSFGK